MPVILDPEKANGWLQEGLTDAEIQSFLNPYDVRKMKARTISKINPRMAASANEPEVTAYYHYPELMEILDPDMFETNF